MDNTDFGDRMKMYEGIESDRRLIPLLPVCARLDGRAFHTSCRKARKPYDETMVGMMEATTKYLVEETQALVGYTQSDEISLLWHSDNIKSQIFFDGRVQKMVSILAAMASTEFDHMVPDLWPCQSTPMFDCRVWTVPNKVEAANTFLWREMDATRNSISSAAQALFSHRELQGKDTKEMQEMMFQQRGVNWNDYPAFFKRGTWVQKRRVTRPFSAEELDRLPPKHEARTNPDLVVERWEVRTLDMPPFVGVRNRVEVLFEGATPEVDVGDKGVSP